MRPLICGSELYAGSRQDFPFLCRRNMDGPCSTGCIDSARIGRILGSHQRTGWGPLKRLTDLIQQQMINVSPLHNRELELLLTSLIAELPEQPVKELKKLLEIYSELLSVNNSRVTDERILQLLEIWKNTANLKKVIVSINR